MKTMTVNSKKKYFQISNGLWKGYNLWKLYQKAHTPYSWHKKLFLYGKKIGIKIFSTPFDESAVEIIIGLPVEIIFFINEMSIISNDATF